MPLVLTSLGQMAAIHGVLTPPHWWQAVVKQAMTIRRDGGDHLGMLREYADGYAEMFDRYYALTGCGRTRFASEAWRAFVAAHTSHLSESLWVKAMKEADRLADQGCDFHVMLRERADGLRCLSGHFHDLVLAPGE